MRPSVPREVDDEIAFHIEMTTRDLMASGMTEANARAEAARRFGDVGTVSAECRELGHDRAQRVRRAELHVELLHDLAYATRQLLRAKGFAAVAVLTLALGIGATTTVFSALYAVVLRPLPFEHAERVVVVAPSVAGQPSTPTAAEFVAVRARTDVFEQVAATVLETGFTITDGDLPELVGGGRVSAGYFGVFAARPELGRVFTPEEDTPGRGNVVVLSHRAWVARYHRDRAVLDRVIHMNGETWTVIGVMPGSFEITQSAEELWVPLALSPQQLSETGAHYLRVVARLKGGVSREQATSAATVAFRAVASTIPDRSTPVAATSAVITSFVDELVGDYKRQLVILLGAVGFVLLIACTNVANLLLARGAARAKEFAIRASLGAGRKRIIRQLLTESILLAGVGAAFGLAFAYVLLGVLLRVSPQGVPRLEQAHIDWHVLLFALAAAVLSSVVFGLFPALRAGDAQLQGTLREGGRSSSAGARSRIRAILVGAEVAMAMTLLTGAGLLLRSAWLVQRVEPGFDPRDVMTARLLLPAARYSAEASIVRAYADIQREATSIPGIRSAALVSVVPLSGSQMHASVSRDAVPADGEAPISANLRLASRGYFEAMRIPIRAGRDIAESDDANAPPAIMLNESLAHRLWPGVPLQQIVGKRVNALSPKRSEAHWMTIVGIVGDIRDGGLSVAVAPEFYTPVAQTPGFLWPFLQRSLVLVVRAANADANVESFAKPLSKAVAAVDPSLPLADAQTMESFMRGSLETARFNTLLLSTLAAVALILAMVGVYGVVAYFVTQRTTEIGMRMALGATPLAIWRLVVRKGLAPIVFGVGVGAILSRVTSGVLQGQLYGVSPGDPWTLAAVGVLLLLVSIIATYAPARRAMRVSPMEALVG